MSAYSVTGVNDAKADAGALRFGLPSKGRLQQQTADFLATAGITFVKSGSDREYAGELHGIDGVELVFLQAGEMPEKLSRGEIHLGVTGEDLIRERSPVWEKRIALLRALDFGHADLVVAVPKCWIDVATIDDLDDVAADFRARHGHPLRIATKYTRLARGFFRERGVANYRLVDSQGATEGTVSAGSAEAIVDITSSGETLRANHLKVLEDGLILQSQAQLCGSLTANWSPKAVAALRSLLTGLGGQSPMTRELPIAAKIDSDGLDRAEPALKRLGALFTQRPLKGFPGEAKLTAPSDKVGLCVDVLTAAGAETVETEAGAQPMVQGTSLFESFVARLENARSAS
ncbi:MAG: ATP phosphoribosyltransferase [Pseudomonadota bacterium]